MYICTSCCYLTIKCLGRHRPSSPFASANFSFSNDYWPNWEWFVPLKAAKHRENISYPAHWDFPYLQNNPPIKHHICTLSAPPCKLHVCDKTTVPDTLILGSACSPHCNSRNKINLLALPVVVIDGIILSMDSPAFLTIRTIHIVKKFIPFKPQCISRYIYICKVRDDSLRFVELYLGVCKEWD